MAKSLNDWIVNFKVKTDGLKAARTELEKINKAVVASAKGDIASSRAERERLNSQKARVKLQQEEIKLQQQQAKQQSQQSTQRARTRADELRDIREQRRQLRASHAETQKQAYWQLAHDKKQMKAIEEAAYRENKWRNQQIAKRKKDLAEAERQAHAENNARNRTSGPNYTGSFRESQRQAYMQQGYENRGYGLGTGRIRASNRLDNLERRGIVSGSPELQARIGEFRTRIAGAGSTAELARVRAEMDAFVSATNRAASAQERLERSMQRSSFAARAMGSSLQNMARSYLGIYALMSGVGSLARTATELDSANSSMLMASGSKEQRAIDKQLILAKARETGSDYLGLTKSFMSIVSSAKDAGLSRQDQLTLWDSVSNMSVSYGLGTEQQKLVAKAIGQMAGKGQVMSEEFKGQLLEQVPGVLGAMMQAAGAKDSADLFKKMEKGQVKVPELVKFVENVKARGISTGAYAEGTSSMSASRGRFILEYQNTVERISAGSFKELHNRFFARMATAIQKLTPFLEGMFSVINKISIALEPFIDGTAYAGLTTLKAFGLVLSGIYQGLSGLDKIIGGGKAGLIEKFFNSLSAGINLLFSTINMFLIEAERLGNGNMFYGVARMFTSSGKKQMYDDLLVAGADKDTASKMSGHYPGTSSYSSSLVDPLALGAGKSPLSSTPFIGPMGDLTAGIGNILGSWIKPAFTPAPPVVMNIYANTDNPERLGEVIKDRIMSVFAPAMPASR